MSKKIKLSNETFLDSSSVIYSKKQLNNILNSIFENPIGEFILWEGNVLKTGDSTWTNLTTWYLLKSKIEFKYPLKSGYKRTAKIYVVKSDNKSKGNIYLRLQDLDGTSYNKEYLFPVTWGSIDDGYKCLDILDFDYDGLTYGHKKIDFTPDFANGGNVRIYKVGLLLYDKPI